MTSNPNFRQHIYLVDDDQEDRELFSEALSHVNKNVKLTEINSGVKLIETLNNPTNPRPDIIFLDINMPKLDGIETLKRIKNGTPDFADLKIVIYSTYSHADDVEEAYRQGASRYYVKPTLFDNIKELISGALIAHKAGMQSRKGFFVKYAV